MEVKSKKIKLTHIICSLRYGGAERFLIDLIKNTDREKYKISVLCVIEGGPLVKDLESLGVKVLIIGKKTKFGISTIWKIYKYLKREKIQIVHTHLFAGDTWGRIAAVLARTPIIISTEHSVNFDEGIIKRLLKKTLSYFTDKIIAISKTVKENSQKRDWINPKKIKVIYNGIELDKFSTSICHSHPASKCERNPRDKNNIFKIHKNITLGFAGRLEKEKGAKYLIETMGFIKKNEGDTSTCRFQKTGLPRSSFPNFGRGLFTMTHCKIKLKILGDGTQRKKLEATSNRYKLKDRIEFLGFKNNPVNFYQEMDILIIPSLWEGLSIVALEAMATGTPIIASNSGGLKEIIKNRETGLLFEAGNSKDLAEKILWAIENFDKINTMAQKAKIKIEDFDINKKVRKYERIYENFTN